MIDKRVRAVYELYYIHLTYMLKDNHDDVLKTRYLKKRQKLLWPLSAFIIIWYIAFLNEGTWTIDKERKLVSGKLLFRSQERTKLYGTILTTTTTMLRKKLTAFPRVFTNTHFGLRIQSINRLTNLSKIHESLPLTFCSISIDPSSNILKSYFFFSSAIMFIFVD